MYENCVFEALIVSLTLVALLPRRVLATEQIKSTLSSSHSLPGSSQTVVYKKYYLEVNKDEKRQYTKLKQDC